MTVVQVRVQIHLNCGGSHFPEYAISDSHICGIGPTSQVCGLGTSVAGLSFVVTLGYFLTYYFDRCIN